MVERPNLGKEKLGLNEPRLKKEWIITTRHPIRLIDLTRGEIPRRDVDPQVWDGYARLAEHKLRVFALTSGLEEPQDFILVGPLLTAKDTNGLLYAAAPDKRFGLDTPDLIEEGLNRPNHNTPGSETLEESEQRVLKLLSTNYSVDKKFRWQNNTDIVIPILKWHKNAQGEREIILTPLVEEKSDLAYVLPCELNDPQDMNSGMGIIYLAAYSPAHSAWNEAVNPGTPSTMRFHSIGTTNVMEHAFHMLEEQHANPIPASHDLQKSPLLAGLEEYVTTGIVPKIDLSSTPLSVSV